jgi:hydroxyacylglutathione hydrolase
MIIKALVVGPFASNCFIVGSKKTKQGIIIDPGADPKNILRTVRDLDLSIELIVATHNHIDHIGALRPVKDETGAAFAIHEADAKEALPALVGRMMGLVMGSLKSPPQPDRLLKDGDLIEVGDMKFKVLHTPGHTPGGISLLCDGIVFSGDTLFNCGIGRTDMSGGDYGKLMKSIATKLMVLPDDTVVYPGHGPETTIGAEKRRNPFLR